MSGTARRACRRLAVLAAGAALFATGQVTAHAAWAPDHHHNGSCGWAFPSSGCGPYGQRACFGAALDCGFGAGHWHWSHEWGWDDHRDHDHGHDHGHDGYDHEDDHHDRY